MRGVSSLMLALMLVATFALSGVGCAGRTKVEFKQAPVFPMVYGKGYGWGENAKDMAEEQALMEAIALSVPRSIEFTYLRVGPYTMFKTDRVEDGEVKLIGAKQLPDGGYLATAEGLRSTETQRWMKFKTTANFSLTCKGETLEERVRMCNGLMYDKAMTIFASRTFGHMPNKLRGNYTFYNVKREDDGKNSLKVHVGVVVGFLGRGKLSPEEKGMVLMNAWRNAAARGAGARGKAIYRQAIKVFPNADYAKEFALYEMDEGRMNNAIMAMKDAIKIAPHEIEYLKILYQIYKKDGSSTRMAEVQKKLEELEAWEDDPGADITTGLRYYTKIRWTEGGDEKQPSGLIQFREMDETEMENMKATEGQE